MNLYKIFCLMAFTIASAKARQDYDDGEGSGDDHHNYHHDTHCTDVSTWSEVKWIEKETVNCTTIFMKEQQWKSETVCDTVTELECNVYPYEKCELKWIPVDYTVSKNVSRSFPINECKEVEVTKVHRKKVPVCRNETKQNCVTLWKKDKYGKKVWAGNEDCEDVTWQVCDLVWKEFNFTVTKNECGPSKETLDWTDCEEITKTQMTTELTCKVHHKTSCKPKTTKKCRTLEYSEWFEKPIKECQPKTILMPNQTWEHREKCLFHGNPRAPTQTPLHHGSNHHQSKNHHDHHDHHQTHHTGHTNRRSKSSLPNDHTSAISIISNGINNKPVATTDNTSKPSKVVARRAIRKKIPLHPSLDGFSLNGGKREKKSLSADFAIKSLSVQDKEIVRKIASKRFPASTKVFPN